MNPPREEPGRHKPASGVHIDLGQPTIVFVTVDAEHRAAWIAQPNVHRLLLEVWREAQAWLVGYYLLMPDHLHLLVEGINEHSDLKKFMKDFKQRTGYWYTHEESSIGNKLWQPGYYEHVLRKEEDTPEVLRYILNNPVRKRLVAHYLDYHYSGSLAMTIKEILF